VEDAWPDCCERIVWKVGSRPLRRYLRNYDVVRSPMFSYSRSCLTHFSCEVDKMAQHIFKSVIAFKLLWGRDILYFDRVNLVELTQLVLFSLLAS